MLTLHYSIIRTARRATRALIVVACLAAAPAALADEVHLANGDRLTGTTVSLADGTLTFSTPYGDVDIPWDEVTSLSVDEAIFATVAAAPPVLVTIAATDTPGEVALSPGGPVPLADISLLARPAPLVTVNGSANAGFVRSSGNTSVNSLRLDGDLVVRAAANRYTALATVTRSEDRGVETARNWSTSLKYDRFVSSRFYINSNGIFTNNRFRNITLRTALGAGLGYQVLSSNRITLTTDAGFGYVNENLASQPDDSYGALRESTALNVFLVPSLVELFHQHDGYFGVTGDENLFVRTQNGIRFTLAAGFVTTLRYDLDYDRTPAEGRENTDRTIALTLGYQF